MQLSFSNDLDGEPRFERGQDVTIHLQPEEVAALGSEAAQLYDWFLSVLASLTMLRTGYVKGDAEHGQPPDLSDLARMIFDLDARLAPRLAGLRNALIRAFDAMGGSHQQLATAMDAPRGTAVSRRASVMEHDPTPWERWATTYPGQRIPDGEVGPGLNERSWVYWWPRTRGRTDLTGI